MAPRKKNPKEVRRFIKFLSVIKKPELAKQVLSSAPEGVTKVIANAALNAAQGPVKLTPVQKRKFKAHSALFSTLLDRKKSVKAKNKYLIQSGGFSFIPLLLSTVLGSLGSALFNRRE